MIKLIAVITAVVICLGLVKCYRGLFRYKEFTIGEDEE